MMRQRDEQLEELVTQVLDCAFDIHKRLGPGLLESVYESILADKLSRIGHKIDRQKPVKVIFDGVEADNGFRADLIINDLLLIELKSVEQLLPVHSKQTLTYIRLLNMKLGLLINFGAPTFREGIKRVANNYQGFVS
ncbi:GxxExxY protein [Alterisphingorhabdus coralli]|uniref:GxxExxY protein n=1 Tax=Alterisphingorhabdus coralli TaxID=3071408 RepID=A0AA97F791_9SPHN|nr:GxxExxY protein [Parasphingorhabdus sp. SCSIO 66989]WOE75669.1 GxxExxY protein [Parasphingorhabdus sp. SCSIO 66989]